MHGCGDLNMWELQVRLGRKLSCAYPTLCALSESCGEVLLTMLGKSFSVTLQTCRKLARDRRFDEAARMYDRFLEILAETVGGMWMVGGKLD